MTEPNRKKLIEVALPLDAINKASAREKSIRHGHPSTLHLWWARRPLATARAVIFAQMVDDPSSHPDLFPTEWDQEKERKRLFRIIEQLVLWENTANEAVLDQAREEIRQSWRYTCAENAGHPRANELFDRHRLPAFHDPFAGGGALPLEAQRLGMDSYASDLNPVAVLINKAMIEVPARFAGKPPVNREARSGQSLVARDWPTTQGLADDVRWYGQWMRREAEGRIGGLYPKVEITSELIRERPDLERYVGRRLTVIAWLWVRTVASPSPAFSKVEVPLASTFVLSAKAGKEAYVEPIVRGNGYQFAVRAGKPPAKGSFKNGTKLSRGANFRCLMSGTPIAGDYIKAEGRAKRIGERMMAMVVEGDRERIYLPPTQEAEDAARRAKPVWRPETELPDDPRNFWTVSYGLDSFGDLFTPRQLVALTSFSDLVQEAREKAQHDAVEAGLADDGVPLVAGGIGASAYADALAVYLGLGIGRSANYWSSLTPWGGDFIVQTFGRQALPMVWDYAEGNPLSASTGNWTGAVEWIEKVMVNALPASANGLASQDDAQTQVISRDKVVSTDPPYYDNIGYADLSDFFYVWLRRALKPVFPDLFSTLTVPKTEELVATPYRHGGPERAEAFFLDGMKQAMHQLAAQVHPGFPVTIYYAFKQAETGSEGTASTGWDTFLEAVIDAGFGISGTWPMRTERAGGFRNKDQNALASSIVLVCRKREVEAPAATRREFVAALKDGLPRAVKDLQRGNIAPVDLAQAAIGPGMAIFTRYAQVLGAGGHPLAVREALTLINQVLDEVLAEQESDFDADSRWALAWFEQFGFSESEYGVAETLSKAKNTSVAGMVEAGFLSSRAGKVRLLRPEELPANWSPTRDSRLTVWEAVHHLVRALDLGEGAAAELVESLGSTADVSRELAYRLYTVCERKKRPAEALAYNALVQSWPELVRLAGGSSGAGDQQSLEV